MSGVTIFCSLLMDVNKCVTSNEYQLFKKFMLINKIFCVHLS